MQKQTQKRFTLPLHALFVVCQYLGAAAVCLGYPGATDPARLWPGGPECPRAALMLWPLILLICAALLDGAWLRALQRDVSEGERGLHRKSLEALSAPVLFLLDLAAIWTVLSCQQAEAANALSVRLHTGAMAAGIILWVYGRRMPHIPYDNLWGIRTPAALKDVQSWGAVHLKAMPGVCACGAVCLVAGTFLSPIPALCTAAICLVAAFAWMFTRR